VSIYFPGAGIIRNRGVFFEGMPSRNPIVGTGCELKVEFSVCLSKIESWVLQEKSRVGQGIIAKKALDAFSSNLHMMA